MGSEFGAETSFWRGSRGCLDHDLGVPEGLEHGFGAGNGGLEGVPSGKCQNRENHGFGAKPGGYTGFGGFLRVFLKNRQNLHKTRAKMGSPKVAFLGKPGKPWFGGSKDRRFLSKQLKTMVLRGFPGVLPATFLLKTALETGSKRGSKPWF